MEAAEKAKMAAIAEKARQEEIEVKKARRQSIFKAQPIRYNNGSMPPVQINKVSKLTSPHTPHFGRARSAK